MQSKYIAIVAVVIIALSGLLVAMNSAGELKAKCCAQCIEGFQPQWDTALYCVHKEKMSQECINYLGIQGIQGTSTSKAYAEKCA